jgi:malonate-semialdehyde dehydrogenase (acetylating) / methylmalonate-semialdehyde dehydrogenase
VERIAHLIDGRRSDRPTERTGPVFDPASGQQTAEVGFAGPEVVDEAVAAARDAGAAWAARPLTGRQPVMFRYRELLLTHREELARLITAEHGKTLADARGEVQRGLEVVEFACGLPQLLKGAHSTEVSSGVDTFTVREPVGVCVGITPFNFPAMVPLWMYPMAIACGNAFVLKPSEKDPSAAVFAAELFARAGLPDGVLNVIHGDRDTVGRLLRHPDVAAVSFVGSTPVARSVYREAAAHAKRVQALGGAKNHMVVLPDADTDVAADAAVSAGYGSAGERCMAISVVVAVGASGDPLVDAIAERIDRLAIGPGDAAGVEMGPLVTAAHRDRVAGYIEAGAEEGADVVRDGRGLVVRDGRGRSEGLGGGFWLGPTLLDHVHPGMSVYTDEIFGPVLCVVRVETFEEAVGLLARNPYGNGVALFTNDGGAARRFQQAVDVGMVGVNVPIPVPLGFYSFGGFGSSMFGAHDIYGPESIDFYTRRKTVITRWPEPSERGIDLGFPAATDDVPGR